MGTYRLTNWICIPPRTLVHGEGRDSTILKWPVDEPTSPTNFTTAAIFGAAPYALEDLTIIVRKTDTALMDMSWEHFYQRNVPPELLPKMKPWGAFRDVFIRRVFFQHWLLCSHPEREPDLAFRRVPHDIEPRIGASRHGLDGTDGIVGGAEFAEQDL